MAENTNSTYPPSEAPPSSRMIQGRSSGAGPYAFGALALAVSIGILLYLKCDAGGGKPPEEPVATTTQPTETVQLPVNAPPPPPPEEEPEEDAGADAGEEDGGKTTPKRLPKGGGACSGCGKGVPSEALKSKVAGTAGLARGCYQRALRSGGAEGSITVSVSVGADGRLCSSSIGSDTLNNPAVSQCVLAKFRAKSYPKPKQGCVVVRVPINFKMKM